MLDEVRQRGKALQRLVRRHGGRLCHTVADPYATEASPRRPGVVWIAGPGAALWRGELVAVDLRSGQVEHCGEQSACGWLPDLVSWVLTREVGR